MAENWKLACRVTTGFCQTVPCISNSEWTNLFFSPPTDTLAMSVGKPSKSRSSYWTTSDGTKRTRPKSRNSTARSRPSCRWMGPGQMEECSPWLQIPIRPLPPLGAPGDCRQGERLKQSMRLQSNPRKRATHDLSPVISVGVRIAMQEVWSTTETPIKLVNITALCATTVTPIN